MDYDVVLICNLLPVKTASSQNFVMFINNSVKTSDHLSRTIAYMDIYFEISLIAG